MTGGERSLADDVVGLPGAGLGDTVAAL